MPTAKRQVRPSMPETIYVQRVIEGDDEPYLLAWDHLAGVDLDNGPVVGVYSFSNLANVIDGERRAEAI